MSSCRFIIQRQGGPHNHRRAYLDRDPLVTVWAALDPATRASGCVQIIPGSHRSGLINPAHHSGFLTEEQTARHCPPDKVVFLELAAGDVALLHNHLLHASDVNRSGTSRRAFSVCYMDARTVTANEATFTRLWEAVAMLGG
jgi:ectoine hydroxylase-related dioxygenase (phytanoyl-CoA dioxygenase family)